MSKVTGQSDTSATHDPCGPHLKGDGSWWARDAQGIELCRVCERCERAKLSKYRPEIITGYSQADVDEPIEALS